MTTGHKSSQYIKFHKNPFRSSIITFLCYSTVSFLWSWHHTWTTGSISLFFCIFAIVRRKFLGKKILPGHSPYKSAYYHPLDISPGQLVNYENYVIFHINRVPFNFLELIHFYTRLKHSISRSRFRVPLVLGTVIEFKRSC